MVLGLGVVQRVLNMDEKGMNAVGLVGRRCLELSVAEAATIAFRGYII
jgi:hypothetical protein